MKKYRFLFLTLLFGIFLIPKDVFAIEQTTNITIYGANYSVLYSCENCSSFNERIPYSPVYTIRIGFPDFYTYKTFKYNLSMNFTIDTTDLFGFSNVGIYQPTASLTINEFKSTGNYCDTSSRCTSSHVFNANWTQSSNQSGMFMEYYVSQPISIYAFNITKLSYGTIGDSTGDVIAGVGQEIIENQNKNQQQTNEKLDKIDDTLNDDDTTSSENQINDFFNNFEDNHHGLSSVITAPLVFIRNLLNHSCTPLHLELPFVDTAVNLPCMKSIYQEHFGLFFNLYQTITTGVIAYSVLIRMFATIKGLQDPQNDKIEVFNL